MLKVLQVGKYYPPYRGGMETHLGDLCESLEDQIDWEVLVAHTERKTVTDHVNGIPVTRLGTPAKLLQNPICPELVHRIRRSTADLVHLHWPNPIALLAYMASGSKKPLVVTYHSDIIKQSLAASLFNPLLHRALKNARIIATSPDYIKSSPILSRHKERCSVIPMGVDPSRFTHPDFNRVRDLRSRFGNKIILTTGRQIYYKGFEYLIQAMQNVEGGHLVLAGDGPMRGELTALAGSLGLANRVSFLGAVSDEDLKACYHAASIFAFPSVARSEAFGIVQLEAMACGKPVVNTSIETGVPFVSRHQETGLTVKPENPAALAQALNTLLSNDRLRHQYGDAARRRVYEDFTLESMGEQTHNLYLEVLGMPIYRKREVSTLAS